MGRAEMTQYTSGLGEFVAALPKAELHLHIEGSFEPELMFEIARRNQVKLAYPTVDDLRAAYSFSELQDFLDIYYQGMSVLQHEQDFYDLTMAYCQRAHADAVRHTEIFFDPQGHTDRGVAFETVVTGITRALKDAHAELGLSSRLIMCFLRHLPEQSALETLEMAMPFKDQICGVGLDSSERGHPPEKFARAFERARAAGFRAVAHAGEEGPPAYVQAALETLQVERIDHGNRALESAQLTAQLVMRGIPLTVCPLSNLRLKVVADLADHPLKTMLAHGLKATVNSDDPAYFGGYINDNFNAVVSALDLDRNDIVQLARNSFEAAFADSQQIQHWLTQLEDYAANSAN